MPDFFDSPETPHFYTVAAVNYFGRSAPSGKILGADAVHYAHRIFFAGSLSKVDEAAYTHTLTVGISRPAQEPIVVRYSFSGRSADTADARLHTDSSVIEAGDTAVVCSVEIADDLAKEDDETFAVKIAGVSGGFVGGSTR